METKILTLSEIQDRIEFVRNEPIIVTHPDFTEELEWITDEWEITQIAMRDLTKFWFYEKESFQNFITGNSFIIAKGIRYVCETFDKQII